MLMTPLKFMLLRIYNLTIGRISFFSKLLKKILIIILIKKSENRYVASSRFFDWRDLEN